MAKRTAVIVVVVVMACIGAFIAATLSGRTLTFLSFLPVKLIAACIAACLLIVVALEALKFIWVPSTRSFIKTFTYLCIGLYTTTIVGPPLVSGAKSARVTVDAEVDNTNSESSTLLFDAEAAFGKLADDWTSSIGPIVLFICFLGYLILTYCIYLLAEHLGH